MLSFSSVRDQTWSGLSCSSFVTPQCCNIAKLPTQSRTLTLFNTWVCISPKSHTHTEVFYSHVKCERMWGRVVVSQSRLSVRSTAGIYKTCCSSSSKFIHKVSLLEVFQTCLCTTLRHNSHRFYSVQYCDSNTRLYLQMGFTVTLLSQSTIDQRAWKFPLSRTYPPSLV